MDISALTQAAFRISNVVANAKDLRSAVEEIESLAREGEGSVVFCDFVAQQIDNLTKLDDLRQRNAAVRYQVLGMASEIDSRKAMDRARGILARRYRVSDDDADAMLRRQSRQSGRNLRDIAASIINADNSVRVRRTA
ncbi:MAG TPA: ANTAR domain-containing protein [Bryobacteraceae bacterium]|nr:ANTAR domain-containing protein [Bryobacteraceae bacterium]